MPVKLRFATALAAMILAVSAAALPAAPAPADSGSAARAATSAPELASAKDKVLAISAPHLAARPGQSLTFDLTLDIAQPYHTMANPASGQFLKPTTLKLAAPVAPAADSAAPPLKIEVTYPPGHATDFGPGLGPLSVYSGRTTFAVRLTVPDSAVPAATRLPLLLSYQACDDFSCLPPTELRLDLPLLITTTAAPPSAVVSNASPAPPSDVAPPSTAAPPPAPRAAESATLSRLRSALENNVLLGLLLILLSGLALNLTPCVFPLLPITMGFFAFQSESRPGRTFHLALLYVLGMAAVFTVLGVLSAFTGSLIGAFLQSPWGVAFVCLVLLVLAVGLFAEFDIQLPGSLLAKLQGRTGATGALLTGATAGLVAAPCVGPFVAALITFVAERGNLFLGGFLFFILALGMGLPYLLLGVFTGLINRIPRGGVWLLWFKKLLSVPIVALILYFLAPYLPGPVVWSLLAGLLISAAIYFGILEGWRQRPWSGNFTAVRIAVAIGLTVAATAIFTMKAVPAMTRGAGPAQAQAAPLPWQPFRDGALAEARAARQPAVLYFTADWCTYCYTLETTVFTDPEVQAAAGDLRFLKVDLTHGTPAGEAGRLKDKYVRGGPPVLIFFDREGRELARESNLSRSQFLDRMAQAQGPRPREIPER